MRLIKIIKSIICSIKGHDMVIAQCPVTKFTSKTCTNCSKGHHNKTSMSFS